VVDCIIWVGCGEGVRRAGPRNPVLECGRISLRQLVSWQGNGITYHLPRRGKSFGQKQVRVYLLFFARKEIQAGEQLYRKYRYDATLASSQSSQENEDFDLSYVEAISPEGGAGP